ncbi:MAG TPA: hypothetical protein VNM37_05580, partial [Candidatus Dormibacteraeota bacterium]|nr:hypothetical protein [Candidatus Dormibacteraeota bacterium]
MKPIHVSLLCAVVPVVFLSACASRSPRAERNEPTPASRPTGAGAAPTMTTTDPAPDPYLWLEDVTGEKAL